MDGSLRLSDERWDSVSTGRSGSAARGTKEVWKKRVGTGDVGWRGSGVLGGEAGGCWVERLGGLLVGGAGGCWMERPGIVGVEGLGGCWGGEARGWRDGRVLGWRGR